MTETGNKKNKKIGTTAYKSADATAMQAETEDTESIRKRLQDCIMANLASVKVTMEREEGFCPANLFDANLAVNECDRSDLTNWRKHGFKSMFQCWWDGAVITITW